MLDISGFATIPETPRRPPTVAPASLHVLKRPPLEGEYISVTDSSGSRVYLRQKEDTGTKVKTPQQRFTCDVEWLAHISGSTYFCLSPGSGLQNCTELPGCTGAVGSANRCVERTRGRKGEWLRLLLLVYDLPSGLHITTLWHKHHIQFFSLYKNEAEISSKWTLPFLLVMLFGASVWAVVIGWWYRVPDHTPACTITSRAQLSIMVLHPLFIA